jgi:beta-glucosidase
MVSETRINESIVRLLTEKMQMGLFENPYVDVANAEKTVGNAEFQKSADLALRKSIVLLRNDAKLLPLAKKTKVYFESNYDTGRPGAAPISVILPKVNNWGLEFVTTREAADVVVLWLTPTIGGLFNSTNAPIELQLSKNKIDVAHVNETTQQKPTVVVINYTNPWVIDEIDNPNVKTVLATFGTSAEALLDVLTGAFNPSGKMPFTTPVSRKAVLDNQSDVPGYLKPKEYALFRLGDGLRY